MSFRIDNHIGQKPGFIRWPERDGPNDIESSQSLKRSSTNDNFTKTQNYQVVPYQQFLPIEKTPTQGQIFFHRKLSRTDGPFPSFVARVYQKYADTVCEKNQITIDLYI